MKYWRLETWRVLKVSWTVLGNRLYDAGPEKKRLYLVCQEDLASFIFAWKKTQEAKFLTVIWKWAEMPWKIFILNFKKTQKAISQALKIFFQCTVVHLYRFSEGNKSFVNSDDSNRTKCLNPKLMFFFMGAC